MSKNLNNFWDDCFEEKNLQLNIISNTKSPLSSNTNRTKPSTSATNNNEILLVSSNQSAKKLQKLKTNKNNKNNIIQKKLNNRTKEFLEKFSSNKTVKTTKKANYRNKNNVLDYKLGRNHSKTNSKSKSKINNISSEELKLRKNLSECTFHPKIISKVKNRNLEEKLLNYSKFTMYERGQIFQMKKKEDGQRMYLELFKKKNKKYPFKPEIHKCPNFKNVVFNDSNYDSLNYFYSRMNSAREYKIKKNKKIPFNIINYDDINKNNIDYINRSVCHHNSLSNEISFIMPKKRNKYLVRNLSRNALTIKILNDKETEICKKNLHKALMNLELNKK
jgi:hypothetical protein